MTPRQRQLALRTNITDVGVAPNVRVSPLAVNPYETPNTPAPDAQGAQTDQDDGIDPNNPLASGPQHDDPREDPEVSIDDDDCVKWIMECRRESYDARRSRMRLNNINRDAYMQIQDWGYKQKGQSTEFLPKVTTSAEQFSAFIKRALIQFGNWFEVETSAELKPYVTDGQVRDLIKLFLSRIPDGPIKFKSIETVIADAAKSGLLESLIVLKVHGRDIQKTKYSLKQSNMLSFPEGKPMPPELKKEKTSQWHLCIDLLRTEDYYPDPTGRGLYEIHEVERDYIDVLNMAKSGIYDLDLVKTLKDDDFPKPEGVLEQRRPQQRGQDRTVPPAKRRRVLITEFWGTILTQDGDIVGTNMLATVANKTKLIRKPVENPFWHEESAFIAEPLIRVPHSVWHKALYDSSSALNFAINEMFNLIVDGGIGAVWGIRQLRTGLLTDIKQVEDGIPQGATLSVRDDTPDGVKVLEQVSTTPDGVMTAGMQVLELLMREYNQASLTNDIQMGSLPMRQVKATEIVSANQSNSVTLSSISSDLETGIIEPLLRKSWLTILQHIDDIDRQEIVKCIGEKAAVLLLSLTEAERYAMFADAASFKVMGLSSLIASAQDFQKLMAFFQAVSQNPVLMQKFVTTYDTGKLLKVLMKNINLNPDDLALTGDQMEALPQVVQQIALFQQMMGGGAATAQDGTGGASGQPQPQPQGPTLGAPPGSPVAAMAGVNQQIQPTSGLQLTGGPAG